MSELLIQLFQYNKEANDRYIQILQSNTGIQDRAIELISHILNAQEVWLDRLAPEPQQKTILPWDRRDTNSLGELNASLQKRTESYLKTNSSEISANNIISYKTTKGQTFENKIIDILHHIINHGSYHRGQISIYLREKEITPPNSDYIMYVRDL